MKDEKKEEQKKSLVKYSEGLASVPLTGFSAREVSLFMSLCYNIQNYITINNIQDFDVAKIDVVHSFSQLRELADFTNTSNIEMVKQLKEMSLKFSQIKIEEAPNKIDFHIILPIVDFSTDYAKGKFKTGIHPEFARSLNERALDGSPGKRYTLADVRAVSSVSSVYSKQCLRSLFRFRSSGIWVTTVEGLKYYLNIPDSYKPADIKRKVLTPIENEFKEADLFDRFEIEERKEQGGGAGRKKVTGYVFKFKFKDENIVKTENFEGVIICPKCGKPISEIKKEDGTVFFGHKDYWMGNCKYTWSKIEDIPSSKADKKEGDQLTILLAYMEYKRREEQENLVTRINEIKEKYPDIYELFDEQDKTQKTFITTMGITKETKKQREEARKIINMYNGMIEESLERVGLPKDYMKYRYLCNDCKDKAIGDLSIVCECEKLRLKEALEWNKTK